MYSIYCWDVVWGDATLLFDDDHGSVYVVDFGSNVYRLNGYELSRVRRAVGGARRTIDFRAPKHVDVLLTHLHYDHYSLLPHVLSGKPIHALYLPGIPWKPAAVREFPLSCLAWRSLLFLRLGL